MTDMIMISPGDLVSGVRRGEGHCYDDGVWLSNFSQIEKREIEGEGRLNRSIIIIITAIFLLLPKHIPTPFHISITYPPPPLLPYRNTKGFHIE